MDWTVKYIKKVYGKSVAKQILANIDHWSIGVSITQ